MRGTACPATIAERKIVSPRVEFQVQLGGECISAQAIHMQQQAAETCCCDVSRDAIYSEPSAQIFNLLNIFLETRIADL
jgi:hypothetical protein